MTNEFQSLSAEPTSSPRRGLRFTVRGMLALTTLVGCLLGWVVRERRQSEFERRVGEELLDQGCQVHFLGLYDSLELDNAKEPQGWWRDLARQILGERVSAVSVHKPYEIEDLALLSDLKNLRNLGLHCKSVNDLTPISGLKNLGTLGLSGASVDTLDPISQFKELKYLVLRGTSVSDVSPLAGMKRLETLVLDGSSVHDVSPLAGMKRLETLVLDDNSSICDVSPLAELKELKHLGLAGTSVHDISPLAGLPRLKELLLVGTSVSDEQIKSLQEAIPNCSIHR